MFSFRQCSEIISQKWFYLILQNEYLPILKTSFLDNAIFLFFDFTVIYFFRKHVMKALKKLFQPLLMHLKLRMLIFNLKFQQMMKNLENGLKVCLQLLKNLSQKKNLLVQLHHHHHRIKMKLSN